MHSPSSPSLSVDRLQEQIHALNGDRLKLLRKIEKQQQKIDGFQQEQDAIVAKVVRKIHPISTKIGQADQQIHDLFAEIFKTRGLSPKKQQKVLSIYQRLQEVGLISNRLEQDIETEPDNSDAGDRLPWETLKTHPEFSQIRQKFLQLAAIFHPDKVSHHQDRDYYTEIMKEINQAYKQGNLAKLIQIEEHYHQGKIRVISKNKGLELKQQIDRLKQENKILKRQYKTLKDHWKSQRRTPEAKVVKTYHELKQKGIYPLDYMKQQSKARLAELEDIRDFVQRFRDKKISTKDFLNERNPSKEFAKFITNMFGFRLSWD